MASHLIESLPIFSNGVHYDHYPFEQLDEHQRALFTDTMMSHGRVSSSTVQITLKSFECYLQITRQSAIPRSQLEFQKMAEGFLGFLYSETHVKATPARRYERAKFFISVIPFLLEKRPYKKNHSLSLSSEDIIKYVRILNELDHRLDKIEYWRGWPIQNTSGGITFLPLWAFYRRLGAEFTRKLYFETHTFLSGRRYRAVPCLSDLGDFIEHYPSDITPAHLTSDLFMSDFWDCFVKYYVKRAYNNGEGQKLSTIALSWNVQYSNFIRNQLIPASMLSGGYAGLPVLPKRLYTESRSKISTGNNGTLVHSKLLYDIPLELTDQAAIYHIFDNLKLSMANLTTWAKAEVADLDARLKRRLQEAPNGKLRWIGDTKEKDSCDFRWLKDRNNPKFFANAARNIEEHSYTYIMAKANQIFASPAAETAHELGLATTGSLYPHCLLLVTMYPKITVGFLENLQIYDNSGKRIGFVPTDSGHQLIGYKLRRGFREAEQVISLCEYGTYLVQQIINVTAYGRRHLMSIGDDNYRYLLLSAVRSFGKFQRPKLASTTTSPVSIERIITGLKRHTCLNHTEATHIAQRANLSTVRATAGVLIYLESKSAKKMSEALGHKTFDPSLLARYLPAPIWDFFQDRWIRIFQAGIIIEAMGGSTYKLKASGFENLEQVEEFLLNHAIKLPPEEKNTCTSKPQHDKTILISLNDQILKELLKISDSRYQSSSHTQSSLWKDLSSKIITYIDTQLTDRPDIQSALINARKKLMMPI
ncbi:hypothetical protein HP436_02045 [Pseudomonas sp. CrR14]|nr:hypothetical protein [Pseudomonas sp. CrR14]